jgi:hypothetical protein
MANERLTEDMVDDLLRKHGFYDDPETVIVEKQQSTVEAIRSALAKAGKGGKGGRGYPEFIITSTDAPDMVVVIECKSEVRFHESPDRDKPVEYAVDGVLHYARHLSPNYTTIAIAVCGNKKSSRWSFMLVPKGEVEPRDLNSPTGAPINKMVPLSDLIAAASFDPAVQTRRTRDLIQFSMEMAGGPGLTKPKWMGAPGLDFETWDRKDSAQPRITPQRRRLHPFGFWIDAKSPTRSSTADRERKVALRSSNRQHPFP